ncbi:MAG: histidine kinase [bacterium]
MSAIAVPTRIASGRPRITRWSWGWIAFGVWTILDAASVVQIALAFNERGQPIYWAPLIAERSVDWYSCALFTPVAVWLVRRFPLDQTPRRVAIPWYLLVTSIGVVLKYAIMMAIIRLATGPQPVSLGRVIIQNFLLEFVIFSGVIAVVHVFVLQQRLAQRDQVALELRAQLSEAELAALKGQLQPHFLFNTLNGVASLIHTAPNTADFIVVQLADLLRASLGHEGTREIPLSDELALLDKYLAIMEARFLGRITIDRDIASETRTAMVPQFLLQPLVENAFEHGIGRRAGAGRIRVHTSIVDGARVRLEVSDNGVGLSHGRAMTEGVGLGNTRRRLERLYGPEQSLLLSSLPDGGAMVAVELPFRPT